MKIVQSTEDLYHYIFGLFLFDLLFGNLIKKLSTITELENHHIVLFLLIDLIKFGNVGMI